MIKRPLNNQFSKAVLAGRKDTTIREENWPVGVPIMLYNWTGKPYRSKHCNVSSIVVTGFWPIVIVHQHDGKMLYGCGMDREKPLWECEGFDSSDAMDDWFRSVVEKGDTVFKHLMRFRLLQRPIPELSLL